MINMALIKESFHLSAILVVCLLGLVIRSGISIHSHSGMNKPPMFGDFEAQRHWLEITYNTPLDVWYFDTPYNDLLYWGLDYPPLTAYHSWIMGSIAAKLDSSWIQLNSSRGMETSSIKQFMRLSVLTSDLVTYIPACVLYFYWGLPKIITDETRLSCFWSFVLTVMCPSLCIIDHGHFQYNCASLGLFVACVACLLKDHIVVGSVFFCLALCYKQMELFHALPIFFYLLGHCLSSRSKLNGLFQLFKLALTVIVTFLLVLMPFLLCENGPDQILQILNRIFPVNRGLFEDKVSNVWCALSVILKFQHYFSNNTMLFVCGSVTLLGCLPVCLKLLQPTLDRPLRKYQFLLGLVICSLSFFLFSYQVHEKSILLVAVPMSLLSPYLPYESVMLNLAACFSMWPLMCKDNLLVPSLCVCVWYGLVGISVYKRLGQFERKFLCSSVACYVAMFVCNVYIPPPISLPFIFPLLISVYSCFLFLLAYGYLNVKFFELVEFRIDQL